MRPILLFDGAATSSFRRRSDIASRRSQAKESGMNPRHGKLVALVSALTIGVAATATAGGGGVTGLAPGGRTLAGPAMARIEMQATDTIYTYPSTGTNSCVTVAGVLGASVRMSLVGNTTSTF